MTSNAHGRATGRVRTAWAAVLAPLLAMACLLPCRASDGVLAWFSEDGSLALRGLDTKAQISRIGPGLYGPNWSGYSRKAAEGSPKQLSEMSWQYEGTLTPDGQDGVLDYTVTAKRTDGGLKLDYEFKARAPVTLNALYIRLDLPLAPAASGTASFADKTITFPVQYGGSGLYYGRGKAAGLTLREGRIRVSAADDAELELQDNREWHDESFSISFHFFHSDRAREVPAGSMFRQSVLLEVDSMKKTAFEPTRKFTTDTSGWFPFDMPRDVPREGDTGFEGAVDFSDTIEKPAGFHGFVKVKGEHFAFEDGTSVKFWGVNLDSGGGLPEKAHAPSVARRMAQLGINLARFTLDGPSPRGILAEGEDTRHIDPEMLDRMDYFIKCLKEQGIYTRLDLMHYRRFKAADGVDAPPEREEGWYGGGPAMYFQPRVEELHKEFARQLLLHENPYTKLRYVDDPGMVFIGIVNENSIFFYPRYMTESGRIQLDSMYDEWAKTHPGGTKLRYFAELERGYYERMYAFLREIGVKVPIACHNMVMNTADGQLQAQVGDHVEFNIYWDHPHRDWRWIWDKPMLKERGGIMLPTTAASVSGKPFAITEINFCDTSHKHEAPLLTLAYASLQDWDAVLWWEYNAAWDAAGKFEEFLGSTQMFTIKDNPMMLAQFGAASVAFRKGYISPGRTRVDVRLTEADVFADPNWIWEQSWSGLKSGSPFDALPLMLRIRSRYDEKADAPKPDIVIQSGTRPAAAAASALKYRSNERNEGATSSAAAVTIPDPVKGAEADPNLAWKEVRDAIHGLKRPLIPEPGASTFVSDTRELSWNTQDGVLTISAPRFQAAVGFLAHKSFHLGDFTLDLTSDPGAPSAAFSAISLCSLDGRPLRESGRILLTLVGRCEDTGQTWEESSEGDFAANAGTAPVLAEPVRGRLIWGGRRLKAYALSASGKRMQAALPTEHGSGESLVFGNAPTMWYELVPE